MVISFNIISQDIAKMARRQFCANIIFKYRKLVNGIAKILEKNSSDIERLMPLHVQNGAMFSFIVAFQDDKEYERISTDITQAINDDTLGDVK